MSLINDNFYESADRVTNSRCPGGGGGTGKECDQESQENKFPFDKISNTFYYCHNHNVFRPTTANIDHADIDGKKHIGDKCMQIQPKSKVHAAER